jgi:hypothetical protein
MFLEGRRIPLSKNAILHFHRYCKSGCCFAQLTACAQYTAHSSYARCQHCRALQFLITTGPQALIMCKQACIQVLIVCNAIAGRCSSSSPLALARCRAWTGSTPSLGA